MKPDLDVRLADHTTIRLGAARPATSSAAGTEHDLIEAVRAADATTASRC